MRTCGVSVAWHTDCRLVNSFSLELASQGLSTCLEETPHAIYKCYSLETDMGERHETDVDASIRDVPLHLRHEEGVAMRSFHCSCSLCTFS